MRALWIQDQSLSLRTDIEPTPLENGVEVNVSLAGICGTDHELLRGYYDFSGVPGHEFVGQVRSGEDQGRRVVADINFGCGRCRYCQISMPHHCEARLVLGIKSASGAFAERIVVPADNLVFVPDHVPDWQAAQAEPLAAAIQILSQVSLEKQRVLLVGAGRLGRMVIRVVKAFSPDAELSVCVRDPSRYLSIIDADFVAPTAVEAANFDVTIDCTGHPEGFKIALQATRAGGTIVVKSTYSEALTVNMSRIVVDEIKVQGSRCGNIQTAIDCLSSGQIDLPVDRLAYFSLEDYSEAFRQSSGFEAEKVFFQF